MSIILNEINYFWKLGFNEFSENIYKKNYKNSIIELHLIDEVINYDKLLNISKSYIKFSQKNFIILELINRIMDKGYNPDSIITKENLFYDLEIKNSNKKFLNIKVLEWEYEYEKKVEELKSEIKIKKSILGYDEKCDLCFYTSRLKAGLIEFKYLVIKKNKTEYSFYNRGLFEKDSKFYPQKLEIEDLIRVKNIGDFVVSNNGTLIDYLGNNEQIVIPEGVTKIKNALFWYKTNIKEVSLPNSLINLGGDTFYGCTNLQKITIPENVEEIGDNPFANCPKLKLKNLSKYFSFKDNLLYDRKYQRLIYSAINNNKKIIKLHQNTISIGKHAFYNCSNIREIIIPKNVRIIENNPFSNLPKLKIKNNSLYFIFKNGALYNKTFTILFYYEHSYKSDKLVIEEGVKIIGRHSFYNCKTIKKIILPSTLEIIGYNPFTNCSKLEIENKSSNFIIDDGILYNKDKSLLIYSPVIKYIPTLNILEGVKEIGRSAFFGNKSIKKIILPNSLKLINRSAFAYCDNLEEVILNKNIEKIESFVFKNCWKLSKENIPLDKVSSDLF